MGASFCFPWGDLLACFLTFKLRFLLPAPLPFIPSCFRPLEVLVCCWIFFFFSFVQVTESRYFFVTHSGLLGAILGARGLELCGPARDSAL